ncbi:hypothetical protein [Kitasatospora sp. NBC_01266]|uniref:hypothetical protein n=1 Tax=Kitasatospora sp. NBC_01266 TaxID=2903572 RepID=UPI002E33CF36|nr:hypothetical protein [Kitasatospora sp. NBC_01266]
MVVALGIGLLLCLLEGGEAAVSALGTPAGGRPGGWQQAAAASAVLAGCWAAVVAVTAMLPSSWLPTAGALLVLLAGLQWLARAMLRLLRAGALPAAAPAERTVFAVLLGAGAEALVVCSALAAAARAPVAGWALGAVLLVGTSVAVALTGRRMLPVLPERAAKTALAIALTGAGAAGSGWPSHCLAVAVVAVVTVAVLRLRTASAVPPATAGGLRGFLLGDTAASWPAVAAFAALTALLGEAWRLPLLAALVAAVLLTVTRPRRPGRGTAPVTG